MRATNLQFFLHPADASHANHDHIPVHVPRRDQGLAENVVGVVVDVGMLDPNVHLPGHVVREVDRVSRVSHSELVQLAVTETNLRRRGNDPEGRVLRLMREQAAGNSRGVGAIFGAVRHVCRGGVG